MALTNKERQARWRATKLHSAEASLLNTVISNPAKGALEILASTYGMTQKAFLETILEELAIVTSKLTEQRLGTSAPLYGNDRTQLYSAEDLKAILRAFVTP